MQGELGYQFYMNGVGEKGYKSTKCKSKLVEATSNHYYCGISVYCLLMIKADGAFWIYKPVTARLVSVKVQQPQKAVNLIIS